MVDSLRVGLVQMEVTEDKSRNIRRAVELIDEVAAQDPQVIVLPENFNFIGAAYQYFEAAEDVEGPTLTALRGKAAEIRKFIVAGTLKVRVEGQKKLANRCFVIDPHGEIQATYTKLHPFVSNVEAEDYRGDAVEQPGDEIVVTTIAGVSVALSVCFDMRFPELFRALALQGAEVILVPSNFTLETGKDHWEVLLRARAIENQLYVAAPAVCGSVAPNGRRRWGRSMVVNPWGLVLAQIPDGEGTLAMDLDLTTARRVRQKLPVWDLRRPDLYSRYLR